MRIQYNSPVILTFTLISTAVLVLDNYLGLPIMGLFTVCSDMGWGNPSTYFRLFSHIAGHANLEHLVGNFTFILLLGPILEEKYGSSNMLIMLVLTGLLTGLLQSFLFSECLLGASGIVFLLIILSSVTNFQSGKIPLTFVLIVILFLGKEVFASFGDNNVSEFAHIIGGICGGVFGFFLQGKNKVEPANKTGPPKI